MKYKLEKPIMGTIGSVKYQCKIEWRNRKFVANEPASNGGMDSGSDSLSLLRSAVASCALVTMRMYIDHKNWEIPVIKVHTNLYQETINEKLQTTIDRDIIFEDYVPDEQKIKLLEIANQCPISKILESDIKLRSYIFKTGETKTIKYGNEEITVLWKPEFCQHSTRCWKQLPQVFKPSVKK